MALTLVTRPGTTLHICDLELLPWDPRLDMRISYDPVTELRAMIYRTQRLSSDNHLRALVLTGIICIQQKLLGSNFQSSSC